MAFAEVELGPGPAVDYSYIPADPVDGGPIELEEGRRDDNDITADITLPSPGEASEAPVTSKGFKRALSTREVVRQAMEQNAKENAEVAISVSPPAKSPAQSSATRQPLNEVQPEIANPQGGMSSTTTPTPLQQAPKRLSPPDMAPRKLPPVGGFHFPNSLVGTSND